MFALKGMPASDSDFDDEQADEADSGEEDDAAARARTVSARSCAEMPVVVPCR